MARVYTGKASKEKSAKNNAAKVKPDARPRRALLDKMPARPDVRVRRGKIVPRPDPSRYRNRTSSTGLDSSRRGNLRDKTPQTTASSSTPPSSPTGTFLTPPMTPASKYQPPAVESDEDDVRSSFSRSNVHPYARSSTHISARPTISSHGHEEAEEDEPLLNHRVKPVRQSQNLRNNGGTRTHQSGTQNDPMVIDSDSDSEFERAPCPQLKTSQNRSSKNHKFSPTETQQEKYTFQRKLGKSRYWKPTSKTPSIQIKKLQGFIEDVLSDAESVETFNGVYIDSDSDEMDLDSDELTKELNELDVSMQWWGESTDESHARKRQRSPDTDNEVNTDMVGKEQHHLSAKKPKRGRAIPSRPKHTAKNACFDLDSEPEDDDEHEFFTKFAAKHQNASVIPYAGAGARQSQKDARAMKNSAHAATSPSPTPSLLSLDFSLLKRDVSLPSVEPTDRSLRLQSRRRKSTAKYVVL